jgi:hypothetical protein
MKRPRLSVSVGLLGLLACLGSVTLLHPQKVAADTEGFVSGSYVTTIKDSTGAFASRGVITLHADHTMSVIDSGQGGPQFFFTSQLGSWKPDETGEVVGRTIDFDFPPNQSVARLDYTLKLGQDSSHRIVQHKMSLNEGFDSNTA